jgi:hypothetical protein
MLSEPVPDGVAVTARCPSPVRSYGCGDLRPAGGIDDECADGIGSEINSDDEGGVVHPFSCINPYGI